MARPQEQIETEIFASPTSENEWKEFIGELVDFVLGTEVGKNENDNYHDAAKKNTE